MSNIYTAVERGMLDTVLSTWSYTSGSYGWYKLVDYAILGIDAGTVCMQVAVNKGAWNKLPEQWRKNATWWAETKAVDAYNKHNALADAKWIPTFSQSGMKILNFPPKEREKLEGGASAVWEDWVGRMKKKGLPGREILDLAKAKRAEVMTKK
jgi:TRAP-type mannitol/chloroaromatic compound transport system substrate-binding protein